MANSTESESHKFDVVVRKILAVSKEELNKRDKQWQKKRAKKKREKS